MVRIFCFMCKKKYKILLRTVNFRPGWKLLMVFFMSYFIEKYGKNVSKISFTHFESMAKEIGWSEIKSSLTNFPTSHIISVFPVLLGFQKKMCPKNCFTYFESIAKLDDPRSKTLILQFFQNYFYEKMCQATNRLILLP